MPRNLPDPTHLVAVRRADPGLAGAMDRVAPFPGFPRGARARGTHFASLARAVVFQQLAGAAAAAIHERVVALTPGPSFPTPEECLSLSDEAFRSAGLSAAKARSIKDLADRVTRGTVRLASIGRRSDQEVVEELTQVWGIGEWSAQIFLMFRLGRLDVLPQSDLGIREGMRRLDGLEERPTPGEVVERARIWQPVRSVAAWVLWRLADTRL